MRRPRPKPAHYRGDYHTRSRALVAAAKANPHTVCWRCGRTIDQHPPTKTGKPPTWTAGHIIDGQVGGVLAPEIASCNYAAGARLQQQRRRPNRTPLY